MAGGLNGRDVIRFSGGQELELPTTGTLGMQNSDYEIFIVGRSSNGGIQFLSAGDSNETYELHLNGDAGARFIPNGYAGGAGASDLGSVRAYTNGQPHVFDVRVDNNIGDPRRRWRDEYGPGQRQCPFRGEHAAHLGPARRRASP